MNRGDQGLGFPTGKNNTLVVPSLANGALITNPPPGFLGVFGNGLFLPFLMPGTYTFTAQISGMHRIRVLGGGGGGAQTYTNGTWCASGGGGAGFAYGVFKLTKGKVYTIIVGAGGVGGFGGSTGGSLAGLPGGTSSFSNLISATGGLGGVAPNTGTALGGLGGRGSGGTFQAIGGRGGNVPAGNGQATGGGGAGSQFGDGGHGADLTLSGIWASAGGAILMPSFGIDASSAFGIGGNNLGGPDCLGVMNATPTNNPLNMVFRFPFDGFTGGGGGNTHGGGIGGGGGAGTSNGAGLPGGIGGGGGAGGTGTGGKGGRGAGGGASGSGGGSVGGDGGDGLVIIEC